MMPKVNQRRRIAKGVLVALAALLFLGGVAYGGVCVWFAVNARSFVFAAVPRISASPQDAGLNDVAEVTIRTDDGERLYGWWKAPLPGHGVILVLCGKGVIVSDTAPLFGDLTGAGLWRARDRLSRQRRLDGDPDRSRAARRRPRRFRFRPRRGAAGENRGIRREPRHRDRRRSGA